MSNKGNRFLSWVLGITTKLGTDVSFNSNFLLGLQIISSRSKARILFWFTFSTPFHIWTFPCVSCSTKRMHLCKRIHGFLILTAAPGAGKEHSNQNKLPKSETVASQNVER